jgi:hypothetical protein
MHDADEHAAVRDAAVRASFARALFVFSVFAVALALVASRGDANAATVIMRTSFVLAFALAVGGAVVALSTWRGQRTPTTTTRALGMLAIPLNTVLAVGIVALNVLLQS